jgi:hypothetical protein
MERSSLRPVLFLFALALACGLYAQSGQHRYLFTLAQPLDEGGEKELIGSLLGWDPNCVLRVNGAKGEVDVRATMATEKGGLQELLWDADMVIVDWYADVPVEAKVRTPIDLPGFPRYYDTGNAASDDRRYDQAKQAWIAEHREAYDHYLKQSE